MKHILLSAIGSHPQLITETLYDLYAAGKPHPDEIYVITTLDSVKKLKQGLLADGQLAKFEAHYSRQAAIFNDNHIWVIEDSVGRPAFDAKNAQEQIAMADFITRKVYALTSRDDVAVHASVSGGRKTMAFYLGYAMSLLGRKQDELSHVFVN
ncbi:CRISPR-associated ring nuclease Csm6 [Shewanella putrefaciens]|uniref:CRISPR-associated ring nuclease Csm6 n=1 Tax=unclassified Shewanella TaxID=196818 RepID=UPI0020051853|nr:MULTISPECIES: CRISPR-associated ring nuclease Csm6 [unclassified Shewanella]MCK7629356.1 CRISPR-associated ring nuclease Csm6 [Shewanella sp. JNE9-1]MCK7652498.1 CRISPR-associated ring nuclease Csm6 [Shewanella sp. JNE4-1]